MCNRKIKLYKLYIKQNNKFQEGIYMDQNVKEIIENVKGKVFIIDTILESEEKYTKLREEIYDYLKTGFEVKELRTCPVKFKFNNYAQSKVHEMQLRHFYCQLCMWYPFMYFGISDLDDSYIINFFDFTAKRRKKFIDEKIIIQIGRAHV